MKLYTAQRAPNPRRVEFFLAEKGPAASQAVERVALDLNAGEHRQEDFLARNPLATVPVLELDDGRCLAESRAICSYFEAQHPEPNLMGQGGDERAFIEMVDRQVEWHFLLPITHCARHSHPGLAPLEPVQMAEYGAAQREKMRVGARWLDARLARSPYLAGERFTIADITAFCALEFARLIRFKPADDGLLQLAAWRERIAARPASAAGMR